MFGVAILNGFHDSAGRIILIYPNQNIRTGTIGEFGPAEGGLGSVGYWDMFYQNFQSLAVCMLEKPWLFQCQVGQP